MGKKVITSFEEFKKKYLPEHEEEEIYEKPPFEDPFTSPEEQKRKAAEEAGRRLARESLERAFKETPLV